MALIGAQELLDLLMRELRPPRGTVIVLRERVSTKDADCNWDVHAPTMPLHMLGRFNRVITQLQFEHSIIRWDGVTDASGNLRRLSLVAPGQDEWE